MGAFSKESPLKSRLRVPASPRPYLALLINEISVDRLLGRSADGVVYGRDAVGIHCVQLVRKLRVVVKHEHGGEINSGGSGEAREERKA